MEREGSVGNILSAQTLVDRYVDRIKRLDRGGPHVNSVLEVNPDAQDIAEQLDKERKQKGPRGPLHGIPILVKDNVDTHDRMQTTAGSFALFGIPAVRDATVAARLRQAGAIILGKTTLSEWGQPPLDALVQRVVWPGPAMPQSLRPGPRSLRLQLGPVHPKGPPIEAAPSVANCSLFASRCRLRPPGLHHGRPGRGWT